jgi:hypothetical protein
MSRKRLTALAAAFVFIFWAWADTACAQQRATAESDLAANSKKAIIETGISEPYFDQHFRLVKVVSEAGDRRVEWNYSVNGYQTLLVDDVGYYTAESGERRDVHSIKNELFQTYEITQTIPQKMAAAALKSCIGKHRQASIVYRALKSPGKAGLYLTAPSISKYGREEGERDREREREREKEKEKEGEREYEGIPFKVGYVDLESGKCTIVRGQVTP